MFQITRINNFKLYLNNLIKFKILKRFKKKTNNRLIFRKLLLLMKIYNQCLILIYKIMMRIKKLKKH